MKFSRLVFAFVWVLGGCASTQPTFQKIGASEYGYRIEATEHKWIFKVFMHLPPKTDSKFQVLYGVRAVGEECESRGYHYFDVGTVSPSEFDGYCYSSADHDGLGVEFAEVGLLKQPRQYIVHSLNSKTKTQLKKGDEILEVNGEPLTSVAQVKTAIAKAILKNDHLIPLKVAREKQILEIKEPIAVFKNSSMGPDVLALSRARTD